MRKADKNPNPTRRRHCFIKLSKKERKKERNPNKHFHFMVMMGSFFFKLIILWNVFLLLFCSVKASVSYDHTAIAINGQRRILISGSIHYPRSTPEVIFFKMCFAGLSKFRHFLLWFCISLCGGLLFFGLFQMWPDLIQKAKEGGLDVIQTYVFWNGHEPTPGKVMKCIFLSN